MKSKPLSIILLIILLGCASSKVSKCDRFLENVTSDFDGNSNFLVIDALVDNQYRKICAPNLELYSKLKKQFNVNEQSYKSLVQKLQAHQDTAKFNLEEVSYYLVAPDNQMKELYGKGLASLKNEYFNENGVQKEKPIENVNYLVSLLFENCVISWTDDKTGYLVIKEEY